MCVQPCTPPSSLCSSNTFETRARSPFTFLLTRDASMVIARVVTRASLPLRRGFASGWAGGPLAGLGGMGGLGVIFEGFGGAVRTVFCVGLAGFTAAVVENTLNDLVLWNICKSHAMPIIDAHPRLQRSLVRGQSHTQQQQQKKNLSLGAPTPNLPRTPVAFQRARLLPLPSSPLLPSSINARTRRAFNTLSRR